MSQHGTDWKNGIYNGDHVAQASGHMSSAPGDGGENQPAGGGGHHGHEGGYGAPGVAFVPEGHGVCPHCTAVVLRHMAELMDCYSRLARFVGEGEALRLLSEMRALHSPSPDS